MLVFHMRIIFLLFFPFSGFGEDLQQSLLPLPNTEYKFECGNQTRVLKTGALIKTKKSAPAGKITPGESEYSMNAQMLTGKDLRKLKMEPWNRLAFVSTLTQAGDKYTEASLRSGNLDKVAFTVGSTYTGQVTEKNTVKEVVKVAVKEPSKEGEKDSATSTVKEGEKEIAVEAAKDGEKEIFKEVVQERVNTDEWKVSIKIESMAKVQFKDESYVSYRIKTTRTKITYQTWIVNVDAVYIPKIGQFLTSSQVYGSSKDVHACKLIDMKSIAAATKK